MGSGVTRHRASLRFELRPMQGHLRQHKLQLEALSAQRWRNVGKHFYFFFRAEREIALQRIVPKCCNVCFFWKLAHYIDMQGLSCRDPIWQPNTDLFSRFCEISKYFFPNFSEISKIRFLAAVCQSVRPSIRPSIRRSVKECQKL